ncbi:hypothetical protein DU478_04180 [Thalassococcus profundi]|uniref:Uncharacterized protein n=1 Tax=Thalassococcus profundi TaxID=2282382 RepID=A0A369TT09_9RHOB|nr:hypothetical protein [Thalassococcus profundi]RDD67864.1 hypothetical protein DU478_04180 [Thalassococcus profundi]
MTLALSDENRTADPVPVAGLRQAEAQLIAMLRLWRSGAESRAEVWNRLCLALGPARGRMCLRAFEDVLRLLHQHGWRDLTVLPPGAMRISDDERGFAAFALQATEADREEALLQATFLVAPAAMLRLVHAAGRLSLPLLCEESRCRLAAAARDA